MENDVKLKLKLLAQGYNWSLSYVENAIYLQRGDDQITYDRSKEQIIAKYTEGNDLIRHELEHELIYDVLLNLTWYPEEMPRYQVKRNGLPISYREWAGETKDSHAYDVLTKLLHDLKHEDISERDFGGNLILAKYAYGVIILYHENGWEPMNVISLEEARAFHSLH